jgi:hypothetical protein
MSFWRKSLLLFFFLKTSFVRSESFLQRIRDFFDREDRGIGIVGGGGELTLKDPLRERFIVRLFARIQRPDDTEEECLWPFGAIGGELTFEYSGNRFFPDTHANYWITPIFISDSTRVVVKAKKPEARYFSIETYSASNLFSTAIGVLRDDEIVMNPDNSTYEVDIGKSGGAVNTIAALPNGQNTGVTWLMFRTYLSEDPTSPAGSVDLPKVFIESITDQLFGRFTVPYCDLAEPICEMITQPLYKTRRQIWFRTPKTIDWIVPPSRWTPFPNGDSRYIGAYVSSVRDRVVVIRGKAPTSGVDGEVRYWSLCKFGTLLSSKTIDCVADEEVPLDEQGRYTVVVSTVENRPANAVLEHGVAWLQWGPQTRGSLGLRFMVPQNGVNLRDYYPESAYCRVETFEAGGADACL